MISQTISHYRILEKIGSGGMGEIYLAEDTKLKRQVALKFLPRQMTADAEARQRFRREAQAAAALNHPNIVTIYEIGEHEDQVFIAMEYVEGQTLKELITVNRTPSTVDPSPITHHPLPITQVIEIATQLASGLAAAHAKGIVHRDVKPQNILVDKSSRVKILDFGLAKLRGVSQLTKESSTLGTVHYMSPEQTMGKEVDQRTDIWSLGVVLYEMLAGDFPFKGDYEQAVIYSILNEEPDPVRSSRADVSDSLERTIGKALAKEPERRYSTMSEMTSDLRKMAAAGEVRANTEKEALPSIAVLPFINMSTDAENEYFSDGLAEELITRISRLRNLRVVARTSAFAFKGKELDIREIGRKLGVRTILEGSVRKSDSRLRITAQLINVADGFHLWSEQYDREVKDIFAIQDEIAHEIVKKLKINLLGEDRSQASSRIEDVEAYQRFLRGRHLVSKYTLVSLYKAIDCFEQVLSEYPAFAPALVGMADAYFFLGFLDLMPPRESFPKAKEMAQKAIALDPSLANAHSLLGLTLLHHDWDWPAAEESLRQALAINDQNSFAHSGYGTYLLVIGKMDEAVNEYLLELQVNPLASRTVVNCGMALMRSERLDEAIAHMQRVIDIEGGNPHAQWLLGQAWFLKNEHDKGIAQIRQAVALSDRNPMILAGLGWALAMNSQSGEAQEIIAELKRRSDEEPIRPYLIAKIYAGLNDADHAFAWLDQSFRQHDPSLAFILTDETLAHLHHDHRFRDLLARLRLSCRDFPS
jgi:serine/threonine protein kinase/Tfp pilus assembly protein PilF